jgi:ribosome-binding protein aMBF1 (putative translation factor)
MNTVNQWMHEGGVSLESLIERTRLERKVVEAIVAGRYTPSPEQRKRFADALGVDVREIQWGHHIEVDHMYGHGPQFGRSP